MTLTFDKTLDVEVDSDGSIESAQTHAPALCNYIDCTEYIKNSSYWKERIKERLAGEEAPEENEPDDCALFKLAADR